MEAEERILKETSELFNRFGIKSITMDDVARHLAMSKKTLYKFFRDKSELVMRCCQHDMVDHECSFRKIAEEAKDPIQELVLLMNHLQSMFARINPNLFYDLRKYHPEAWKYFQQFKNEKMMVVVEENLRKGVEQGLYRKDLNIPAMARLRMEEVEMGWNPDLFPANQFNIADIQVALLDHFMHGISTLKGHRLINQYKQIVDEE